MRLDVKSNDQWTAIMYAAFNNHLNIVQLLIKHNANISSQDKSGDTVVYLVARHGNLEIMKLLLDKDYGVANIKGSEGCTPLIMATRSGHLEICNYLVTHKKVDINIKDDNKKTALDWAILLKHTKIEELLITNQTSWS